MKIFFNRKTFGITILLIFLLGFVLLPAYADEYDDLQQHQNKADQFSKKSDQAQKDSAAYNKQIKDLEPQINQKQSDLDKLVSQLDRAKADLSKSENDLANAELNLDNKNEILEKRLSTMYKDGDAGYLEIILGSKNFTDMINRYEFIQKIAEQDSKLLQDIKTAKAEIQKKRDIQKEAKAKIEADQNNVKIETASLTGKKAEKEQLMKRAESDAKIYAQLEDEEMNKAQEISNALRARTGKNPYIGGRMSWPTPGYNSITSPFGPRIHPIFKTVRFHSGIDIGASMGATVVSAQSGTVIFAQYGWNGGYGNFMVIDHGGGITTAYAHLSSINVTEGQTVKRDQPVARVGSTGNSTGPHLHFEVRRNGNLENPINWVRG